MGPFQVLELMVIGFGIAIVWAIILAAAPDPKPIDWDAEVKKWRNLPVANKETVLRAKKEQISEIW